MNHYYDNNSNLKSDIRTVEYTFKGTSEIALDSEFTPNFKAIKDALLEDKPKDTIETMFDVDIWAIAEDRKDAFDCLIPSIFTEMGTQINHRKSRLPVMGMENIGEEINQRQCF